MLSKKKKIFVEYNSKELDNLFDILSKNKMQNPDIKVSNDFLKIFEEYKKISKEMEVQLMQMGVLAPNLAEGNYVDIVENEFFQMLIFNGMQEVGFKKDDKGEMQEIDISGNSITIKENGAEVDVIASSSVGNFFGRIKVPQRLNVEASGILQKDEAFFPQAIVADFEHRLKEFKKDFNGLKSEVAALKVQGSSDRLAVELAQSNHGYILGRFNFRNPEQINALKMKSSLSFNLEVKDLDEIIFLTSKEFLTMLKDASKINPEFEGIKDENIRTRLGLYSLLISKGGDFFEEDVVKRINKMIEENKKRGGYPSNVIFVAMKRAKT